MKKLCVMVLCITLVCFVYASVDASELNKPDIEKRLKKVKSDLNDVDKIYIAHNAAFGVARRVCRENLKELDNIEQILNKHKSEEENLNYCLSKIADVKSLRKEAKELIKIADKLQRMTLQF